MKIGRTTAFASVLLIMLGGVVIASSLGLFDTESSKTAANIKMGEFQGKADPNDIRGSFSFADIAGQFEVSPAILAAAFGIEGGEVEIAAFQIKGLEEKYAGLPQEIGTSSVRLFVGFMTGLPVELGAYIPLQAADIIRQKATALTEERLSYLDTHTIDLKSEQKEPEASVSLEEEAAGPAKNTVVLKPSEAEVKPASSTASNLVSSKEEEEAAASSQEAVSQNEKTQEEESAPEATQEVAENEAGAVIEPVKISEPGQEEGLPAEVNRTQAAPTEEHESKKEDRSVKGNTTIFDLMSWGIPREQIGPAIGIEIPRDNGAKIRDLLIEAGKSFEDAKGILQKMVDDSN